MRARTLAIAAFLLGLALAFGAAAQDLAAIPPLKARVTDLTGTLSAAQVATLENSLAAFEQKKGSQIAVLLVPTTKPEAIEQYGIRVAEQWKVGRKGVDDGVIIVVAKDDHRLRIEVGYGLEGAIPDIKAKRVIREVMAPHFVDGDFYGGLQAGTQALMKLIEGEDLPPAAAPRAPPGGGAVDYESTLVLLLVVTIILAGVLTRLFGRFFGSVLTGGAAGIIAWIVAGVLAIGIVAAVLAFIFALAFGGTGLGATRSHRGGWGPGGGWPTGGWSGGSGGFGGGSWSGGGGTFGGGGASGSWGD